MGKHAAAMTKTISRVQVCCLLVSCCFVLTSAASRPAKFTNKSQRRADVHWDNDMWGDLIGTVEPGKSLSVNTFNGHGFWMTAHGVGTALLHATDNNSPKKRASFTIKPDQEEYELLPVTTPLLGNCIDRFAACTKQGTKHMCNANPGWMIVNCAASCKQHINVNGQDSCALQDRHKRCTFDTMGTTANPAVGPNDLGKRFESMINDFPELKPKLLSGPAAHPLTQSNQLCDDEESQKCRAIPDGPWILRFDNFASDQEMDALIQEARNLGFERSTEQGQMTESGEQEKTVSPARTSLNTWCTHECSNQADVLRLRHRIGKVTQTPIHNHESLQVLSYDIGQFYKPHQDESGPDGDIDLAGPRIMTAFLYLSDVEDGGETGFPRVQKEFYKDGLAVKPKKGSMVIWANMLDADPMKLPDSRTLHEARPVKSGHKYAANAWIHMDNYEAPNTWGCTGSFS